MGEGGPHCISLRYSGTPTRESELGLPLSTEPALLAGSGPSFPLVSTSAPCTLRVEEEAGHPRGNEWPCLSSLSRFLARSEAALNGGAQGGGCQHPISELRTQL